MVLERGATAIEGDKRCYPKLTGGRKTQDDGCIDHRIIVQQPHYIMQDKSINRAIEDHPTYNTRARQATRTIMQ